MPPPMYPFLFHGPSALRPARLLVLHATPNVPPFIFSRTVGTLPRP